MTTLEIDAQQAKQWLDSGDAVLVDVREPDEFAREHIAGARLVPLSRFDPAKAASNGKKVVLQCQGGRRSLDALRMLGSTGVGTEAYSLKGGLQAWKSAGLPVETSARVPISILRQVQMAAGALVLAGVVLGVTVSPWFLALSGFVGAGLIFAGASGFCGMAVVLGAMPWNRMPGNQPPPAC